MGVTKPNGLFQYVDCTTTCKAIKIAKYWVVSTFSRLCA